MRYFEESRSRGVFALALALSSIGSCSPAGRPSLPSPGPDAILLYEGLPHQGYEAGKFAEEKMKPTVAKGGFSFYREPLALGQADTKTLGRILAEPSLFRPFEGEKKCGGFHPDYAIVATSKGEETTYLICFGCGEAKVYRPGGIETRYDLGRDATDPSLASLLKPYHRDRPMPIGGP